MNDQKKKEKRGSEKARKEKGMRVRMAKGRVRKDGMEVGNRWGWREMVWGQSLTEL